MKAIVINPETGLMRTGWRILFFMVIFVAFSFGSMIGVRAILGGLKRGSNLQFAVLAISATVAVFLARKYLDRKSMTSLGLKWDVHAMLDIVAGVVNSAIVMACVFFTLLMTSLIQFNGFNWWREDSVNIDWGIAMILPVVLSTVFQLAIVAWWEEIVFRGYILQNMIGGLGLTWSVILSSAVFAIGHAFNPDATALSILLIALITPQLIYAYIKSGQLWLPIGLHLGWNFFQASIFGFDSSGQASPSLISQTPVGPDWLSGGEFGAEGSIIIIPFTLLSFLLIHYWVQMNPRPNRSSPVRQDVVGPSEERTIGLEV